MLYATVGREKWIMLSDYSVIKSYLLLAKNYIISTLSGYL